MSQQPSAPATEQSKADKTYKDTLNLPQTDFKMKAGAATREPELEAFWDEKQVYQQAMARRKAQQKPKFVLHDGPPYLSSDKIHIGTALNKILKDIVTRYQYQKGHYAPYIPGYDSHGLPIENAVVKDLKGGRHSISEAELRGRCREFALKNLDGQEANFKRLGVWGDWKHPYITMNAEFEACQIKLFHEMFKKGYVYKGLKPVYWSPTSESALAEAEVEYADHTSHSIYVGFKYAEMGSGKLSHSMLESTSFIIWTTTPWTLPANLALSVHPDFEYVVINTDEFGKLVVAKGLLEQFSKHIKLENPQIVAEFKGKDIEKIWVQHPFIPERQVPVLCGTHVTLEAGTGIVHTAPGHGMEDYVICQQYNQHDPHFKEHPLPILSPLDNKGCFDFTGIEELYSPAIREKLSGQFYEKANETILEILRKNNALLGHSKFTHSYPHDWRTHKPVIYRATEQWFVNINDLRQDALAAIKTVRWIPERGEARISAMVEGRTDWCISRQRVWGVPIPVFYDADTREMIIGDEIIDHIHNLFAQHTSDIWWAQSADELLAGLPEAVKKKHGIGARRLEKEMDIMDVWFDSGVTHTAVVEARQEEFTSRPNEAALPVELYLEGSDQHRGWFQSSLLTSVMLRNSAPYKTVLTHGFVLDQEGRKMSKSLGNVVDPNKVMNQYGADILRLWVASVDYTVDIRIGDHILAQLAETYKKVRNTFRFMLGNLYDFNPATDAVEINSGETSALSKLDQFVLHRLQGLVERVTADFDKYEFHRYNHEIQYFCGNDLSALYFDITKDILYCDAKNHPRRRAVQTVIHQTLLTLLPMLVPIMPHLAEDIWLSMPEVLKPQQDGKIPDSVTLLDWPKPDQRFANTSLSEQMQLYWSYRDAALLALEKARSEGKIGSALEAQLVLSGDIDSKLDLEEFCVVSLVSQVQSVKQPPENALAQTDYVNAAKQTTVISVLAAEGEECQRCWKHQTEVGQNPNHPGLCARCAEAVDALS